jgi:hypothetical protein
LWICGVSDVPDVAPKAAAVLPCNLLSSMHLVVAGPTTAKFATAVRNIVTRGTKTPQRLDLSSTPATPDGGYVNAMATGRAACIEK